MKIFTEGPDSWHEKVNFVDENNVVLGYDMHQSCCEHADWFIDDKPWQEELPVDLDSYKNTDGYDGWTFDTSFCEQVNGLERVDEGGMIIFKITKDDKEKYIHIFNCHNGYYSHGFDFTSGETVLKEGYL